jgi:putative flippase GtrA
MNGEKRRVAVGKMMRWLKFNAVGALGMVVQLPALAVFNRWIAGHYLVATAAAIEVTLLHNFAWHALYTWRDRRGEGAVLRQMVRFHLSNGAVSMVGNLALMPILVGEAGMPVLAANGVAILVCSGVNFFLGEEWVFRARGQRRGRQEAGMVASRL